MANRIVEMISDQQLKKEVPQFSVGDTVDVATRIIEGEKERTQVFTGTVIARKGRGVTEAFTVRRIVNNEGVERVFPLHSPFVSSVTVRRSGQTRRAKLYYLRDRVGKSVRLTEKRREKKAEPTVAGTETAAVAETAST